MGTIVTVDVAASDATDALERALRWFADIEQMCSRFDEGSELRRVCARVGEPVPASPLLCQLLAFALEVAEACGLPCVVSSALETSVGMAAGIALAAALPELDYACGLATLSLLDGDVSTDSLTPVNGFLPVVTRAPAPDRIAEFETEQTAWIERYERVRARLRAST